MLATACTDAAAAATAAAAGAAPGAALDGDSLLATVLDTARRLRLAAGRPR
jgi:hypothetical protein